MDKIYIINQLRHLSDKVGFELGDDVLDAVLEFSKFKVYSKGATLAGIGENAAYSGIVINGVVRSYYIDVVGNDITKFFSTEGGLCMEEGMMGFDETVAMWESLEDSTVMLFEVSRMKRLIMSDERLKSIWIKLLESGMRYKIYRENAFLTANATQRYLDFKTRYPELSVRVPQRYIATYLGIKPESLSRIKGALKEKIL